MDADKIINRINDNKDNSKKWKSSYCNRDLIQDGKEIKVEIDSK